MLIHVCLRDHEGLHSSHPHPLQKLQEDRVLMGEVRPSPQGSWNVSILLHARWGAREMLIQRLGCMLTLPAGLEQLCRAGLVNVRESGCPCRMGCAGQRVSHRRAGRGREADSVKHLPLINDSAGSYCRIFSLETP